MKQSRDLQELLDRIDHRGYPAYKDTAGSYDFGGYVLSIDHVQGDPFAAPSKLSIHINGKKAGFPEEMRRERHTRIALQDALLRRFAREVAEYSFKARGSGKSGLIAVSRQDQEVIERSACEIGSGTGDLIFRLEVGFPANGRTINARELQKILFQFLPACVKKSLYYQSWDAKKLQKVIDLAEDQHVIRGELKKRGLVAFVANGAVLPRESGISNRPMKGAVEFRSPASMEVTLQLPHAGEVRGMGIPKGITLIVGGGYHGKSTLLKALERGVYDHIGGDGREFVITDDTAVKIRAEDGRSIQNSDISMFINGLPNGEDTASFSTANASGSTSQAANVIEAMEAGAGVLLIDEDTSATNFMIRDELMARVVHADMEPITPFIDRVEALYQEFGISTILVAGSCGEYFQKADCVVQMLNYKPLEITAKAKEEAERFLSKESIQREIRDYTRPDFSKRVFAGKKPAGEKRGGGKPFKKERTKVKAMDVSAAVVGDETIELRYVEQIADAEQVMALGYLTQYAKKHLFDGKKTLQQVVGQLENLIQEKGIAAVCEGSYLPSGLAMPRTQEIYACLNRSRSLKS